MTMEPVDDILRVQIAHALRDLLANDDNVTKIKFHARLEDMDMTVEGGALTPLGKNGKGWLPHPPHEVEHIRMTSLFQDSNLF